MGIPLVAEIQIWIIVAVSEVLSFEYIQSKSMAILLWYNSRINECKTTSENILTTDVTRFSFCFSDNEIEMNILCYLCFFLKGILCHSTNETAPAKVFVAGSALMNNSNAQVEDSHNYCEVGWFPWPWVCVIVFCHKLSSNMNAGVNGNCQFWGMLFLLFKFQQGNLNISW